MIPTAAKAAIGPHQHQDDGQERASEQDDGLNGIGPDDGLDSAKRAVGNTESAHQQDGLLWRERRCDRQCESGQ